METEHILFDNGKLISAILCGKVVSFPTETVYGLGVVYDSMEAFEKLVEVKKRQPDKPFTLMLGRIEDIEKYAYVNDKINRVISHFMPGEITILIKPRENLYEWVTLNSKYIGIRVPDYKEVCSLINEVGKPLLVTSANMSGDPILKNYEEVCDVFDGKVSYIVKGETRSSKPSTIVICDEDLSLVREGNISFEDIKKVWGGK